MAIDSTLFAGKVAAATYAVGDRINLGVIRGPATVRDGYGTVKMKRLFTCATVASTLWTIHVKNSNWVDEMSNIAVGSTDIAILGNESGAIQSGHDVELFPNSGWQVYAECILAGTEAADADLIALIDLDYPSIAAVQNPKQSSGEPVTIENIYAITSTAKGSVSTAPVWTTFNIDVFKAGYKYLLTEAALRNGTQSFGFVSISGAAGQAGLERIMPCRTENNGGLRYSLDYSTPLVKGPMNLNILAIGTATSAYVYMDYVKKKL